MDQCSAKVSRGSTSRFYDCRKLAKVTRDGKHYCSVHDPVTISVRHGVSKERAEERMKRARIELRGPMLLNALRLYLKAGLGNSTDHELQLTAYNAARKAVEGL